MLKVRMIAAVAVLAHLVVFAEASYGQAFGVELFNSLMPASGGMGGASVARPQDLQSTLMGNPATLTQKRGTQFSFSGSWVEPTININNQANLPLIGIGQFRDKSKRPGSVVGNIALTQDVEALGLPATVGIGLLTASGLGVDYRDQPASNGTVAELLVLGTAAAAGVQLTDRLAIGGQAKLATAVLDGVFTGISGMTPDYNVRGTVGLTYDCNDSTTLGAFWKTEQKHQFENFVRVPLTNVYQDVRLSLPSTWGIGVANNALMDGKLLLALDVLYFEWDNTDLFGALWTNQLGVQAGMQYAVNDRCRLRFGYTYAEDATRDVVLDNIGGVIDPTPAANYVQALFPNINQHRISGGVGVKNLLPGVDVDLFGGGMFREFGQYGLTGANVASYWVGFGTTWRFGRGACGGTGAPNCW